MTVPEDVVGAMYGIAGARWTDGAADLTTKVDGVENRTAGLPIAPTPVPASGSMAVPVSGPLYSVAAGAAGTRTITAGPFTAKMKLWQD